MATAHLQSKAATTQNATTASSITETFDSPVANGSLIVLAVMTFKTVVPAGNVTTITDTYGNTYNLARDSASSGDRECSIWYAQNVIGGASFAVTATIDSAGDHLLMGISEYRGAAKSNALVMTQIGSGTSTTPTMTLTPPVADEKNIYFAFFEAFMGAGSITPNDNGRSTNIAYHQYSHQDIVNASGAQTLDWTIGASAFWQVLGAVFRQDVNNARPDKGRLRPRPFGPGHAR